MTLPTRDSKYHTYGDYLIWSREHGDEVIDGVAYIKEPPSPTASHQLIAGELYRQNGEPTVSKLVGRTALTAVPGVVIRWKPVVNDLTYG